MKVVGCGWKPPEVAMTFLSPTALLCGDNIDGLSPERGCDPEDVAPRNPATSCSCSLVECIRAMTASGQALYLTTAFKVLPVEGVTNPAGGDTVSRLSPEASGWKFTVPLAEPPLIVTGLLEIVPTLDEPLITEIISVNPPASACAATGESVVGSSCIAWTVSDVVPAPTEVPKSCPIPSWLTSTKPDGVKLTVIVPELQLAADAVSVAVPEDCNACT